MPLHGVGVVAEADDAMLHRIKIVPAHLMFWDLVSTPFMICAALDGLPNLDWSAWQISRMSVGRSRSVTQDHFTEPVEDDDDDEVPEDKSSRYSKRRANLYDAVAGMLSRLILSLGP